MSTSFAVIVVLDVEAIDFIEFLVALAKVSPNLSTWLVRSLLN